MNTEQRNLDVVIVSYNRHIIKVFGNRDEAFNWLQSENEDKFEKPENFYSYYAFSFDNYEMYCN